MMGDNEKVTRKVQNNRLHTKSKHQSMQMSQITNNFQVSSNNINKLRETACVNNGAFMMEKNVHTSNTKIFQNISKTFS